MSRIDLGNNIKVPKTVPATVEGFYERTDSEHTGRICAELADFEESRLRGELDKSEYKSLKDKTKIDAFFYTPHAHFEKGYKSRENEPVDSGKAILDVDGNPNGREVYTQRVMGRERELGINMFNISISGTGFAVLFDIPEGLDRKQAQAWMAHELGDVAYDKGVHDVERAVYIPCREYILYIDEELMFGDELHPAVLKEEEIRKFGNSESVRSEIHESEEPSGKTYPTEYHGIPFTEILRKYWEINNKGYEPTEGDRDTLTFQLASDLRHICGKNFRWLDQIIPCYDGFPLEEKRQKIRNALNSKYEGMPTRLRAVLDALGHQQEDAQPVSEEPVVTQETTMQSSLSEIYASSMPPKMPEQLPKLIKLLTKNTPTILKPTVAHAVFPALGAHLHKVQFLYTDNVLHEATLMNVAMAGTGGGKGCIDEPINRIMADIRERDKENEHRLEEYNKEVNRKGNNKDKRERPEDLVIQEVHSDITHAALVQRLAEGNDRFLYFKLNEIELFDKLKGTGGQQFVLMCQAFDPNNRYGQTRASTQAVNATVKLRFNWNAAGTIGAVVKYFSKVLTKGPISRINFCTIPEREIGAEQPVYGIYDDEFDNQLKPFIRNLTGASGEVECKQARSLAKRLIAECADFSRLSQDRVFENLSFRANVIAYLKACVLYVANGQKWEKSIESFIRWSLHYDLWCKMRFFADGIRREQNVGLRTNQRGPRNLLEMLPDEFTIEDARRMRRIQGLDNSEFATLRMVRQWKFRQYVLQITDYSFKKAMYKKVEE